MHLTYRKADSKVKPAPPDPIGEAGAPKIENDELASIRALKDFAQSDSIESGEGRFSDDELQKIEVTPAMIEAGINEYGLFDWGDPGEWVVAAIYRGMELQRRRDAKAAAAVSQSRPKSRAGAR